MARQTFDIIVVGAGLSGLMAAATAHAAGAKVALVHGGLGTFAYGAGCVSDLGQTPDPAAVAALGAFRAFAAAAGTAYDGVAGETHALPTLLGTLLPVNLAPRALWAGRALPGRRGAVVGISGLSSFEASFVTTRLNHVNPGAFVPRVIELPRQDGLPHTPLALANRFDRDPGFRQLLAERLAEVSGDCDHVLVPAILGQWSDDATLAALAEAVGREVAEMATLPPSVAGLRLSNRWLAHLRRLGVVLHGGYPLLGLDLADGRCRGVAVATPGHAHVLAAAQAVVLATGPQSAGLLPGWRGRLDPAHRPLDDDGRPMVQGLHLAGALADPTARHGGNGRAIISGHAAAVAALTREVDHATH